MAVTSAQVAAVPGTAQQRRELAGFEAEHLEDGCELFREQEEPAIGDGLLIAQRVEDGAGCGAAGGHTARSPEWVGFGEEAGDLAPAGPFAGLARFADENDEEIETVTRVTDAAVRSVADEVAEGSQELQEDGGGIGLGMWGEAIDDETSRTMESRTGYRRLWWRG
jgi:hypothetical protein